MHPAVTLKRIFTPTFWSKYKMIKTILIYYLCIYNPVIIIIVAIIAGRTYKLLVHNRDKVSIYTYILVHVAKQWTYTFIFHTTICVHSFYYFSSFKWFRLIIIVGDHFSKISW